MNIRQLGFLAVLAAGSLAAFAQTPPPNDNFTNATVLTGTSLTFSGTLAGATYEGNPELTNIYWYSPSGGGSVWWSWTAPVSSTVVITGLRSPSSPSPSNTTFEIYVGADLNSLTSFYCCNGLFRDPLGRYMRFSATAGTTYRFRMAGTGSQPFSLKLITTNPPIFIFQPQGCAVSPYGTAFFSAMATGPTPLEWQRETTYQWFYNGTPIPGETFPSLLVHGVTTNQVGSYSVIASNVGGVTQAGAAMLTLVDTNPVPRLVPLRQSSSNLISFSLTGEGGRWYRIESSQDLQNLVGTNWIQLTNATAIVSLPRLGPTHFVRASLDVPTDVCIGQLKQMRWAVHVHTIEGQFSPYASYTFQDIKAYVPINSWGNIYGCPEGGIYSPGATVLDPVTCSLSSRGHVLPDP